MFGEKGVEATQDDILEQPTCARDSALNISCVGCGR